MREAPLDTTPAPWYTVGIDAHRENHMAEKMDETLRFVIQDFERRFPKSRPLCVLACRGAADEHWLVFHPNDLTHPFASVDKDGEGFEHV